jgi:hypothetical protein
MLHRLPVTIYEVDLGLHRTVITADLPSRDQAVSFQATISVQWRVFSPSDVVRHQVVDIEEALSALLLRRARGITRNFSILQMSAAEDKMNEGLRGVAIDVTAPAGIQEAMRKATELGCIGAEYGLWTSAITHMTLDEAATEHSTKMIKLNWAIEEEEAEQRLRIIKNKNQQEIMAKRVEVYREIIAAGDVERFALRLSSHPDEISAITSIIREDQLTSRRDTIEFISRMVDSGVVERWEVSDQVKEALEWLRDATARVVTDKNHPHAQTDQTLRQSRRGRGEPVEESGGTQPPSEIIMATAEAVPLEQDAEPGPPPGAVVTDAEEAPPVTRPESSESAGQQE